MKSPDRVATKLGTIPRRCAACQPAWCRTVRSFTCSAKAARVAACDRGGLSAIGATI
ncbi:hypothetical protein [Methylobacterium aquaticum]|uniref:hypothetical protein n=1 Tax=Methylobacterium aquaticum TaxID=270351 RepID=UPI001FF06324|nr:hypothetical protein [Methylobacterium aquaticum]